MKERHVYKYRLYVFFNDRPIQGPYSKDNLEDYIHVLDELFLTDAYPSVHIDIIKHENEADSPFFICFTKEQYLEFRDTYLVKNKRKVLTKEMKKCNLNYGEEVENQKYMNL